jgi:hypothetical protein
MQTILVIVARMLLHPCIAHRGPDFKCHIGNCAGWRNRSASVTVLGVQRTHWRQLEGTVLKGDVRSDMPSLFRFLFVVVAFVGLFTAGMWFLATKYEPVQREEVKVVPGVKIRKE